jgi:aminopeptidase N
VAFDPQMGLGEFGYGLSGAAWYPVTIMGDVFKAHMVIRTPANMEAVSNGAVVKREKSTEAGTKGRFEFDTKKPVMGLYFAYGPYVVQESQVGPIHYYTYFRESNASKHDAYIKVTDRILSFYSSKYAPFPYEKMAMVEVPLPPFLGGVGPASLMFLHERMVAHKDVPENLLAHELAHQWFGNLVPINMIDERYNQWLSEGFATYSDALFTEHTEGHEALVHHMQRYGQLFFQFFMMAPRGQGAIRTTYPSSALYRPVIYEKGALVLHMLRKVMGDEKFFKLMRDYVEQYKFKATTLDDFRRLASSVYGEDLSWFFSEWIDQTVFAHWTVNVEVPEKPEAGGYKVKISINQPDDLVKMPADITLHGAGGETKVIANVMLDKKEQVVEDVCAFKPVKVVVDEDFWVLRHPGSDNIWPKETEKAAAAP